MRAKPLLLLSAATLVSLCVYQFHFLTAIPIKFNRPSSITYIQLHEWVITNTTAAPDGVEKPGVLHINGQSPGPEIHAVVGERLVVTVSNQISEFVSVHWHGLRQMGNNHMDGAMGITECGIPPGESFTYEMTLDKPGTYWYHAHNKFQQIDGLIGALVVYEKEPASYDPVLILQDWYHGSSKAIYKYYMSRASGGFEPVPDSGLINGIGKFKEVGEIPRIEFEQSESKNTRLRVINAAALADFMFSIDNHTMRVIEADSTLIKPVKGSKLKISPGQRYSVELSLQGAAYFRAEMTMEGFQYIPEHLDPTALAILKPSQGDPASKEEDYSSYNDGRPPSIISPKLLEPLHAHSAPEPDIQLQVTIQTMKLEKVDLAPFIFFNRTTFQPAIGASNLLVALGLADISGSIDVPTVSQANEKYGGSQLIADIPHGAVVELIINNPDDSHHPIHFHGHDFWVMYTYESKRGLGGWSPKNVEFYDNTPMVRDTHVVPMLGHTVIRWRADNPGIWAFHCHVLWHHMAGLLMQFAHGMDRFNETIPQEQLDFCKIQRDMGASLIEPLPQGKDRQ